MGLKVAPLAPDKGLSALPKYTRTTILLGHKTEAFWGYFCLRPDTHHGLAHDKPMHDSLYPGGLNEA
jgi:hypothetical protein